MPPSLPCSTANHCRVAVSALCKLRLEKVKEKIKRMCTIFPCHRLGEIRLFGQTIGRRWHCGTSVRLCDDVLLTPFCHCLLTNGAGPAFVTNWTAPLLTNCLLPTWTASHRTFIFGYLNFKLREFVEVYARSGTSISFQTYRL